MKKQNGFSQIFVMVVMLILAIALPVTANLVKKVQDNRSSAAPINCVGFNYATCQANSSSCDWAGSPSSNLGVCTNEKVTCSSSSCQGCNDGDSCSKTSGCTWGYYNSFLSCVKKTTSTSSSCLTAECPNGCNADGSCKSTSSACITAECPNGCNADGSCKSTSSACITAECPNGCNADGSCKSASVSQPGTGGTSGADCSDEGSHCWGEAYKAGCTGTKLATDNNCASKATVCAGTYYDTYNGCGDSRGCLGTKDCTPAAEVITCEGYIYLKNYPDVAAAGWSPRLHYDTVHANEPGRIWSSALCIGNVAYNCDAGHGSPYNTATCEYGCDAGHCKGAPAPVCTPNCACADSTLVGQTCSNGCGGTCAGTKPAPVVCTPNCACADSTLVGQTCSNGCGGTCAGTKPAPVTKWKVTGGSCNTSTGNYLCSSGTDSSFTFGTQAECVASSGCDVIVCEAGNKRCSGDNAQICRTDGSDWTNTDCGTLGCNATTKACNVCTPGAEQCSGTTSRVCKADGSGWTDTACGAIGCNATTKVCNVCTPGNQKCSTSNDYFTCISSGTWTSTKTDCSSGKICTNLQEGTNVCTEPAYAAPKINLLFAIFGINSNATLPCLGDNKFTVTIYKDGVIGGIKTDNVLATAVSVDNSTVQVFKISNFQLSNNIALTDKIKISIGGRKTLAIIYGKNNQETGFPTTAASQILVSSLVTDNNLNLYKFPLLNGDIGSAGNIGVKDNVIDGIDFAHMSNQWNKRCTAGQNLESDLNGDCYVDGLDLQIYKKALEKQYSQ